MNKVYVTPNEATEANLNENKRILKWSPFMNKVYVTPNEATEANMNEDKRILKVPMKRNFLLACSKELSK